MDFEINGEDTELGPDSNLGSSFPRKMQEKMFLEEEPEDFCGFDTISVDPIESDRRVLQKLIAETESLKGPSPKRQRTTRSALWKNLKNADSMIEEADDSINSINSDNDISAVTLDTTNALDDTYKSEAENNSLISNSKKQKEQKEPKESKEPKELKEQKKNRSSQVMNTSESARQSKGGTDLSNPAYREPFAYGWKREMVYRGTTPDNAGKRLADIYYYTPEGKKVRSYREVVKCLTSSKLTIDNFTFFKEPLGMNDTNLEIIREAKKPKDAINHKPMVTKTPIKPATKPPPVKTPITKPVVKSSTKQIPMKSLNKSVSKLIEPTPETSTSSFSPIIDSPIKKKVIKEVPMKATRRTETKIKTLLPFTKTLKEQEARNNFMSNICAGYQALSQVFQYLKVHELLRAARVCRMWRDLAAHPSLWKTVTMKNSQVTDWDSFAETLKMRNTQILDLRKIIIVKNADHVWEKFVQIIPRVTSLKKLELCKCPPTVVEEIMKNCPQLQVLNALSIQCEALTLEPVSNLTSCQELRLKSIGVAINNMTLHGDLTPLAKLTDLTHLSLTSVKDLGKKHVDVIKSLVKLQSLELGECSDFSDKFGTTVLIKLKNLERLRLEKGQDNCNIFDILKGISKLENLSQLELVNFDVKHGFDKNLANCKNIKRLLIIPTYVSQSATTNNMLIGGVAELSDSLTHFVWGVTQELLKVTELFRDQNTQPGKQITGDSIPVLKPVPFFNLIEDLVKDKSNEKDDKKSSTSNPQVEILPLSHLQKLLLNVLPKTRVKILKIPFHATWRQLISGSTTQK